MPPFLALLDRPAPPALIPPIARIAPFVLPSHISPSLLPSHASYFILAPLDSPPQVEDVVRWLDAGADKVVVPLACASDFIDVVPPERLVLSLDVSAAAAVPDSLRLAVSGVLLKTPALDPDLLTTISRFFADTAVYVELTVDDPPSPASIRSLCASRACFIIPVSRLTTQATQSESDSPPLLDITDAFLAAVTSDRPDGLFPTVVSSFSQGGKALGLVYSSASSVRESILSGKGVYQSRKHGLWKKGETSGATQDVIKASIDCDSDSLEFSVVQHGSGFCHLARSSCFGHLSGLSALERTLQSRLQAAPEGSYTRRLFNDPALLRAKIMEEADELCNAQTKDQVAFEAADLLYFALARCVVAGVSIADIEHSLDLKAKKVTRRPGSAKSQWAERSRKSTGETQENPRAENDLIRMRSVFLDSVSDDERARLFKRPVIRSDEMIAKVKPIVDAVRTHGDAALLELTVKFDRAQLTCPVRRPPFFPKEGNVDLNEDVRVAIDTAYANIRKFHVAQLDSAPLVVETFPGVVCTRFARPIARVGLYVPGGTAILPSTALMLGIPAQVAGCQEIVLATPPRHDGTVSPEVLYAAHLIGASAIVLAGGAQAIAAMAYGTESVPKVDKIFGPGNQWVTAAKMLVQNDTDAQVSIDMPAGPSEVLVVADSSANPSFVAADLLSQAEHGVDSQVVLVSFGLNPAERAAIDNELDRQARLLPRVEIVRKSIAQSLAVAARDIDEAIAFANEYAPEHLILQIRDAPAALDKIQNAGSVFVGHYTPESCGDYASGTNHTLPTNGYARQFSGVNTQSFQKHITSQEITRSGLQKLGPTVVTLADCEGLAAHANAVRIRIGELDLDKACLE